MVYKSRFKRLKSVYLPPFSGTRVLMLPIRMEDINTLPDDLAHYKQTVQELINISPPGHNKLPEASFTRPVGVGYLTIDERSVEKNQTLRLRGLHVDGMGADGNLNTGAWAISGYKGYICSMWNEGLTRWHQCAAGIGGMLTVSSPAGCRAWSKDFEGKIDWNGDCEALREKFFPDEEGHIFEAGVAYWCNSACVHESLPMQQETQRQFVRLSMPSDAPWHTGWTRNPKGVKPGGIILPQGGWVLNKEPEIVLKG